MSRIDDPSLNPNHRVFDHTAEIAARAGLTREAARQEIEKFRGVAEYETRKLIGQRTNLRQPEVPDENTHPQQQADHRVEESQVEKPSATPAAETAAEEAAIKAQPVTTDQPASRES